MTAVSEAERWMWFENNQTYKITFGFWVTKLKLIAYPLGSISLYRYILKMLNMQMDHLYQVPYLLVLFKRIGSELLPCLSHQM